MFSDAEVGLAGSAYLSGAVIGALFFGWLTDRLGRKKLFFITIAVYLTATALTGASWNGWSFFLFRFFTGAGIGGEYAAINSTIQELVPARYRGFTDLVINGSFWVGAALGALVAVALLNPAWIGPEIGWRLAFLVGAGLGIVVFVMRMWIPESPRWLVIHGRAAEAEAAVADIEQRFRNAGVALAAVDANAAIGLRSRDPHVDRGGVRHAIQKISHAHAGRPDADGGAGVFLQRDLLHLCAGADEILCRSAPIASAGTSCRSPPAISSGRWCSAVSSTRVGRRRMICLTYALSGLLLVGCGALFEQDLLTALTQTLGWMIVFFFASPAASAAYLTVSETFPIEIRAVTIAIFYAIGTGIGGVAAPFIFGKLIASGSRDSVFAGYAVAAALMLCAALVAALFAVRAEGKSLEEVAAPLSADA